MICNSKSTALSNAFNIYKLFVAGEVNLDVVINALNPFVKGLVFRTANRFDDELLASVHEKIVKLIQSKNLPADLPKFFKYIKVSIRRVIFDYKVSGKETNIGYRIDLFPSEIYTPKQMELLVFAKEILNEVRMDVLDRIRFIDTYRDFCIKLMDMYLGLNNFSVEWIFQLYNLPSKKKVFLKDYIVILIKSSIYKYRSLVRCLI